MKNHIYLSLILSISIISCYAQNSISSKSPSSIIPEQTKSVLDNYIQDIMKKEHIPGLQVHISKNGETAYQANFGYADLSYNIPVVDTTRFQSGSIAKMATSLGIAILEKEGKLSFNDKLIKFFPNAPSSWSGITLFHLLDQTSGLQNPNFGWTEEFSTEEFLTRAYEKPLAFAPGSQFSYQNVNADLLGIITTKISELSWQEFQEKRIFEPLDMKNTHAISYREIVPASARPYQWENNRHLKAVPEFSKAVLNLASGSLWTTAEDWTKLLLSYTHFHLFDSLFVKQTLLSSRKLNDGYPINYSFGNYIGVINGHKTLEHGGGTPGFRTFAILFPEKKLTIMIAFNLGSSTDRKIAHTIAAIVDPELKINPYTILTEKEMKNLDLERLTGKYIFPDWGEMSFIVKDNKLFTKAEWFEDECYMISGSACTPGEESRFEFVENKEGTIEGVLFFDSAYDKGWFVKRID